MKRAAADTHKTPPWAAEDPGGGYVNNKSFSRGLDKNTRYRHPRKAKNLGHKAEHSTASPRRVPGFPPINFRKATEGPGRYYAIDGQDSGIELEGPSRPQNTSGRHNPSELALPSDGKNSTSAR